jgi:hypothetical protein
MQKNPKQIKYLFNINSNCKKTLKKISKEPNNIFETDKEWIYTYIIEKEDRENFISELNNMKLHFVQRVI